MRQIKQAIKTIETNLQICIKEYSKAAAHESQYYELDGQLKSLQLSELHIENFETLQPVYSMVKTLVFFECTFNTNNIVEGLKQFTALESIVLWVDSILTIPFFLQLEEIKELDLIIDYEIIPLNTLIVDFSRLKSIKKLSIYSKNVNSDKMIVFKGAEHLYNLEKLELECDCIIEDLNKFKNLKHLLTESIQLQVTNKLESLNTLEIKVLLDDYEIYSLEQFPNLESLQIYGCKEINIGKLDKLKLLAIGSEEFDLGNTNCFDHLPNLEKLELYTPKNIELKNLDKLSNLMALDLKENYTIKNIEGLESLKKLEYLNLYQNQISDVRVLNKLPKLKEVNIAGNNITQEDVEKQLERPEIARFLSYPWMPANNVPFDIFRGY